MNSKQTSITVHVEGMSCAACELRIEKGLSQLAGVESVNASYGTGSVDIIFDDQQIDLSSIENKLDKLHYPIISSVPKTSAKKQWIQVGVVLLILAASYFILQNTIGFDFFNSFQLADESTSLSVLFIIGLLTSVHCIAMCGGINISQNAKANVGTSRSKFKSLYPSLLYNGGRVVSYTIIGGIVGAIGAVLTPTLQFQGTITLVAAALMVLMGLNLVGAFPALRKLNPRMPKFFARKVIAGKVGKGPFIVGLLNGLMPCGPLQAMQIYALTTGSFLTGALSMFLFSAGTVPLMFALGALSTLLSTKFTNVMMKVSAILVILLGVIMMNRGLLLMGINPLF